MAPPRTGLVAAEGCAMELLVDAPQSVQSPRVRRVRVIHDTVLEREGAHPGRLTGVRRYVGPGHRRVLDRTLAGFERPRHVSRRKVVFDDTLMLLLLGDRHVEVEVEIAAERGRPGKGPLHPPLVGLDGGDRGE